MSTIVDTYKHKGQRDALVNQLMQKGIQDSRVLAAIRQIPRHIFFTPEFSHFAYEDKAFPIGSGQTISQPYTVAFQSALLELKPGMRVLEIGTGSGYQCAVLCALDVEVHSIELHAPLHKSASRILNQLGFNPQLRCANGYAGWPEAAPFDRIIVTAGATEIPESLLSQLNTDGILIIPVGSGDDLEMTKIKRMDEKRFERSRHGIFRFVPFVKN